MKKIFVACMLCAALILSACTSQLAPKAVFSRHDENGTALINGVNIVFLAKAQNGVTPEYALDIADAATEQFLDLIYDAKAAQGVPNPYSPELSASHVIRLSSPSGVLTMYYDNHLNFLCIPINRRQGSVTTRTYLIYAPQALNTLVTSYEALAVEALAQNTDTSQDTTSTEDDSFQGSDDMLVTGAQYPFAPDSYTAQGPEPLFAFLTNQEDSSVIPGVYKIVCYAGEDFDQLTISSIEENESYIRVVLEKTPGQAAQPSAVLIARADVEKGAKPAVFITPDGQVYKIINLTPLPETTPEPSVTPEGAQIA